ncbi:MAG: AAA family ATPase, partial [Ardenticatenaceae bacterium]
LFLSQTDYQWQVHPVIRLDFGVMAVKSADELESALHDFLQNYAEQNQITLRSGRYYTQFSDLIYKLSVKGQVVILIDEYDKPLIDNLSNVEEA